jgi:biotin carboxyl carrier protein
VPNERRPSRAAREPDAPGTSVAGVEGAPQPRSAAGRLDDHAAIDRLVDDLLPALVAKLSATELGEIEVREGAWKVRLRRPTDGRAPGRRSQERSGERASRSQPGHEGHGHARGATESHRPARAAGVSSPASGSGSSTPLSGSSGSSGSNGSAPLAPLPVGPGRPIEIQTRAILNEPHRVVATSPAVGIYQPRSELTPGTRVRAGDRLGSVNMLGVPQEVVAPADGVVGAGYADPGDAVEYGQELVAIELIPLTVDGGDGGVGRPGGSLGGGA